MSKQAKDNRRLQLSRVSNPAADERVPADELSVDTINLVWPTFLDGCSLTRDTEGLLLPTGKWDAVDLRPGSNRGHFNPMPHIQGTLTKAEL